MTDSNYTVTDRRPIAARRLAVMHQLAGALVKAKVSANQISVAGMISGILAGACLAATSHTGSWIARLLWILAAGFVQLRLLANLLDGMVAIASGTASQLGEIFNEAPDRVSDAATLVGMGYAIGGNPALGWLAAVLAILTAYVRMLGKTVGNGSDFRGPMAKQQRMFIATIFSIFAAVAPASIQQWKPAQWGLVIICAGCVLTLWRRMAVIVSFLRRKGLG